MEPNDLYIAPGAEQFHTVGTEGIWDDIKAEVMGQGFKDNALNERDKVMARSNLAITNFVKKLMIMSRVFIQNSIVDDPSLNDNLNTIQNQYLAFILAALSLNEDIGNNRTIRKQIELVATENYHSLQDIFIDAGMEAGGNYQNRNGYGRHGQWPYEDYDLYTDAELDEIARKDPDFYQQLMDDKEEDRRKDARSDRNRVERDKEEKRKEQERYDRDKSRRDREDDERYEKNWERSDREFERNLDRKDIERRRQEKYENGKRMRDIGVDKLERDTRMKVEPATNARIDKDTRNLSLASGRIVQVNIGGKPVTIPVQLLPTVIPDDVCEKFISLNFQLTWRQRLIQAKAGEISWIKDFLFNVDQIDRVQKALKQDKTGVLYEMKERQKNAAFEAVKKSINDSSKQNIANAIFIFEKSSFLRNAKAFGLNWHNPASRDRFFNYTFSFMCVLIDPVYAKSEYYWSGIDAVGEYSSKNLKNSAEKDAYNLKDIMTAFTQGQSPKFM